MAVLSFEIENMHCGACVRSVLQALRTVPGTQAEEVRVGSARVQTEVDAQQVADVLGAAGFPARLQTSAAANSGPAGP